VKYDEVLREVKGEINIQHTVKRKNSNWIGHISRKICLMKYVIKETTEEKIGGTRR
jgi:hypothetical protein